MKTYNVSVHYEVGAVLTIEADSLEEAEQKALEFMADDGTPEDVGNVVHRDYFIVDSEEK